MTPLKVLFNGEQLTVADGAVLGDILHEHDSECSVALIRPTTTEEKDTKALEVKTTGGPVTVELNQSAAGILGVLHAPLFVRWEDRYGIAFGAFRADFKPSRTPFLYERGDLVLGCAGYNPDQSFLFFSRERHSADHGSQKEGGVIGKVVRGRGILDRFHSGDVIESITPLLAIADTTHAFTTKDFTFPLENGMSIISKVVIFGHGFTRDSIDITNSEIVEHLLMGLEKKSFIVGRSSSTHIRDDHLINTDLAGGKSLPRREGSVTIRTKGRSAGAIYINTTDLPRTTSHASAGQVIQGIELAQIAKAGELFEVKLEPKRFDLVGLPVTDAKERSVDRGIEFNFDNIETDRVVVYQEPGTTLEVLAEGKVKLVTASYSEVVDIMLDDSSSPDTCAIFRKITGLSLHAVGKIPFFFGFDDVYLFKPKIPTGIQIIPENTPNDVVPANTLAMTNESRKGVGLVGVRLTDNSEFGPTSEPFEGTNIIGKLLNPDKLTGLKENSIIFIREVVK